jgi:polar amino acid transport system ATP-binding protein
VPGGGAVGPAHTVSDAADSGDTVAVNAASPTDARRPAAPLLEVVGLQKDFGRKRVLDGVDFALAEGEKVCIVGPSGSGKTSLLRCLNLLIEPTGGKLLHRGELIGDWPDRPPSINLRAYRQRIGMVFQHFELFPHLTALGNVTLAPRHILGEKRADAREKASRLLREIGLDHVAGAHPHTLSGGQKQRIAIARALAMDPELILFDEPTSALDPEMVGEVLRLMAALAEAGTTMAIVTHELAFARHVADRLVVMEAGRIVEQGPTAQMFDAPANPRTREILQLESGWGYKP